MAAEFAQHWASLNSHHESFEDAARDDDVTTMRGLIAALRVAARGFDVPEKVVRAFVDRFGSEGWSAATSATICGNNLGALRLLHECGADLDLGTTQEGATPSEIAAQNGRTASM